MTVEHQADAFHPVATCTTRYQVVAFQRLGYVVMNYKSDIRLVDAHTERNGGHHDVDFFIQKIILVFHPHVCIEPCMIRDGLEAVHVEQLGDLLDLLPAETVDYP